jgi:magnesium-transporting ATPase (P-type)
VTLFLYEAYTSFSGQAFYNDWAMALYNVLFTSLPVIAMGVFDQDVSARFCLKVLNKLLLISACNCKLSSIVETSKCVKHGE